MLEQLAASYGAGARWLNDNQGVAGVGIFLITLFLGWVSGIFSALRRRPKFRITLIEGPTFCCTFPIGGERDGMPLHRTGIALYLAVANIGSAASSIDSVAVAYHWHLRPFSRLWVQYRIGWCWLQSQTAIVHDFQAKIGENTKIYPFLTQRSILSESDPSAFLEPGRATNGVVYFEQSDSRGGCFPSASDGQVRIKVSIRDVFGRAHKARFEIPWFQWKTLAAITLRSERRSRNFAMKRCLMTSASNLAGGADDLAAGARPPSGHFYIRDRMPNPRSLIKEKHERYQVGLLVEELNRRHRSTFQVVAEPDPPEAIIRSGRTTRWAEVVTAFWTEAYARDLNSYATPGETTSRSGTARS